MFLVSLLVALQAQDVPAPTQSDTRLHQAIEAIQAGRLDEAVKKADSLAEDYEKRFNRSKTNCVFSSDSLAQALLLSTIATKKGCTKSSIVEGDFAEAYFVKGFALYDLGKFDAAIEAFGEAIELSPMTPRYWMERAECYKSLGDWDRAYKDFEAAADNAVLGDLDDEKAKANDMARAYRGMAFVKVEQNDLPTARKLLEKALAAKPDDPRTKEDIVDLEQRERS